MRKYQRNLDYVKKQFLLLPKRLLLTMLIVCRGRAPKMNRTKISLGKPAGRNFCGISAGPCSKEKEQ